MVAVNNSFSNFDKTLFSLEGGYHYNFTMLNVSNGSMQWMPSEREFMVNAIVFDANAVNLTLNRTDIMGIHTQFSSPVIYIENDPTSSDKAILNIDQSNFHNNSASVQAGVVYALNTDVVIDRSGFINNSAGTGDAGALYLDCEDSVTYSCNYNISNSVFHNNSAMINGGAIKYSYYKPNVTDNNTFTLNKAMYGSDMASYPVQMIIT